MDAYKNYLVKTHKLTATKQFFFATAFWSCSFSVLSDFLLDSNIVFLLVTTRVFLFPLFG